MNYPMMQVGPAYIPSASSVPNEYVPVDLPQLVMSANPPYDSMLRVPSPASAPVSISHSPGASVTIGSPGSILMPYAKGMADYQDGVDPIVFKLAIVGALIVVVSAFCQRSSK